MISRIVLKTFWHTPFLALFIRHPICNFHLLTLSAFQESTVPSIFWCKRNYTQNLAVESNKDVLSHTGMAHPTVSNTSFLMSLQSRSHMRLYSSEGLTRAGRSISERVHSYVSLFYGLSTCPHVLLYGAS